MKNVLLFCGKKQAGKSSCAKFLCGVSLLKNGYVEKFNQNEDGDLLVPTNDGWGILDVYSKNKDITDWLSTSLWNDTKIFSFAEELKESVISIFGIDRNLVYGTDKDKNKKTHIKVGDLIKMVSEENRAEYEELKPNSYVTIRQLLQVFGTDICRTLDYDCWVRNTFEKIKQSSAELCVIDDCRFESEFLFSNKNFKKFGIDEVYPILCLGEQEESTHSSEKFKFDEKVFPLVLDKTKMTLREKNDRLKEYLLSEGLLTVSA